MIGGTESFQADKTIVYDALQHGKPQREDDGTGALQRVAVADGDDRTAADLCRQRPC